MLRKLPSVGKRSGLCCPSGCFARCPFVDGLIQHYDLLGLRRKRGKVSPRCVSSALLLKFTPIISGTRWMRINVIYPSPSFTMALQPGTKAFTERKATSTSSIRESKGFKTVMGTGVLIDGLSAPLIWGEPLSRSSSDKKSWHFQQVTNE